MLRADEGTQLETLFEHPIKDVRSDKRIQVLIDRDPTSMM